jgi:hypothetical protein
MKATFLSAMFTVALLGHAVADDQSMAVEMAANNLSHEMSQCCAFHKVVAACFLQSNFKQESEQARKEAGIYLEWAASLGNRAGISKINEVLVARDNMAVKALRELIDNDCRNLSIALDKYGDRCKAIADDPAAALAKYIAQAERRMPKTGSSVR